MSAFFSIKEGTLETMGKVPLEVWSNGLIAPWGLLGILETKSGPTQETKRWALGKPGAFPTHGMVVQHTLLLKMHVRFLGSSTWARDWILTS